MKKATYIFILFFIFSEVVFASVNNLKSILDSAYNAYKKGDYQTCIDHYQKIEKKGLSSAYLYYNMGNAYFRLHQFAKSILYYERALKLKPSDIDILHNLQFANTFVSDKINELPTPFYISWFKSLIQIFSANTWAWIAILSFLFILILIYLNFLTASSFISKTLKISTVFFLLVFIISLTSAYFTYQNHSKHNQAIIMTESVEVKSSPDEKGTTLFVIHEGTKVIITDNFEEWAEIRLLDGNTGWVKQSDIERI